MSSTHDTGGPAHSVNGPNGDHPGMSLLDHFAGMAMQSIVMRAEVDALSNNRRAIAGGAYQIAEEMIAEKRRREGGGT